MAKCVCRVNISKEPGCAPEPEKNLLPLPGLEPGTVQPELRPLSYLKTRYIFWECRIADSTDSSGSVWGAGGCEFHDKWVPVITAWRVHRLRKEEQPAVWRVAVNILNNESRTTDKVWFSIFCVGRGANNSLNPYLDTNCPYRKPRTWTENLVRT